jgi:predicted small lipoprotein YifL
MSNRVVLATIVALAACTERTPLYPPNAPAAIVTACKFTERKCTACHERDRWLDRRYTPEQWNDTVTEMRLLPGSNISPQDATTVLECLHYRSSIK